MIIDSLKKVLSDSTSIPPALMIYGEEEFLREEAYHTVLRTLMPDGNAHHDMEIVDAESSNEAQIVDMADAFPFISEKKIIIVKQADKLFAGKASKKTQTRSPLLHYLQSPQSTTFLLLTGVFPSLTGLKSARKNPKQSEKAKKITSSIPAPLQAIIDIIPAYECAKVSERELISWTNTRLAEYGKSITQEAAEYLITNAGLSLRDIANELEKLMLFAPERKQYNEEDVLGLVGSSRMFNVFELQKAIGRGDGAKSVEIVHHMMNSDGNAIMIISMLLRYFSALFRLTDAQAQGANPYEIAKIVGINAYFLPEYQSALRIFPPMKLARAFYLLRNADLTLKSTSQSPVIVLQTLMIGLLA
ncbi:MAG: DNA polymerase III subunit delta [Bacteroidetes bacterium]|nr:DNA polymerase III subunit delta [bacterium]NBP63434.1 DNA polymerase III subunit delta [Bacteroidota bacterium]